MDEFEGDNNTMGAFRQCHVLGLVLHSRDHQLRSVESGNTFLRNVSLSGNESLVGSAGRLRAPHVSARYSLRYICEIV